MKISPYSPQIGAANYTTMFNASPAQKKTLRGPSQLSGSPPLEDRPPRRDIVHATQPFRDYADGGHVESDRNLAALAEREAAEARGKRLDEESFDLLFSNDAADMVDKADKMTLGRTVGEGGSRGVWKGTWSTDASSSRKEEEPSLLD